MHSQNQVPPITSLIDRVRHITGVQVQVHPHVLTIRLQQIQEITTAVHLRAAVAVEATAVAVVPEAVVHIPVVLLPVVPAEVLADQVAELVVDLQGVVHVHQEVVHLRGADKINATA